MKRMGTSHNSKQVFIYMLYQKTVILGALEKFPLGAKFNVSNYRLQVWCSSCFEEQDTQIIQKIK